LVFALFGLIVNPGRYLGPVVVSGPIMFVVACVAAFVAKSR
jgi:hypothetical protein